MRQYLYQMKQLTKLAFPVFIAQTTQMLMGFIDTVMAGGISAVDMAAVAVGGSIWFPIVLFVSGLLLPLTPVVAHHHGAGQPEKIRPALHQGFYLAIIGSLLAMVLLSLSPFILRNMQLEPDLYRLSKGYLYGILWGAPAFAMFQVLRSCNEGISYTGPTMLIGFIGLAINIPANYIFIYGHFGVPAYGGAGCGIATAIVFWVMAIALSLYIHFHKRFKDIALFLELSRPNLVTIWGMTRLGFPVAMSVFFEISLFAIIALVIAPLGAIIVAGHQVAINFSSMLFMLPMSIGIAISIRIGYYLGRKKYESAIISARASLIFGLIFSLCTATFTIIFRELIIALYTDDIAVTAIAAHLLLLAAFYQVSDAIQAIAAGALRGYKDTTACFYITFISYWLVGFSLGYSLSMTDIIVPKMGVSGFWIGIFAGLTLASILFYARLRYIQKNYNEQQMSV